MRAAPSRPSSRSWTSCGERRAAPRQLSKQPREREEATEPKQNTEQSAASWEFVREQGGGLELTVVNPTGIFGPVLSPRLSSSVALVKAMLEGSAPPMPRVYFGVVDVRDVADIHIRAMTHPKAAGERFLAGSEISITYRQLSEIIAERLGERLGERAARLPVRELTDDQVRAAASTNTAMRDAALRLGRAAVIRTSKARDVLGWMPRPMADTLAETAQSLRAQTAG